MHNSLMVNIIEEVKMAVETHNPVVSGKHIFPNLSLGEWILELMDYVLAVIAVAVTSKDDLKRFREKMVQVAAITLACIEAHDRENNEKDNGQDH